MKKNKKPVIDESKLGNNLFLINLKIPVNKVVLSGQYKPDKDGDLLPVEVELEKDAICKVYVDANRRKMMVLLSARAKDLLLWLIYEVESGKDWLWINKDRYMAESNVKAYNTYKDARNELINNSFLQSTTIQNVYFINPHFFFNGSRVNNFPKNVVRK